MATTARDIIEAALRKLHVLGKGQSLDDAEAQDALEALNDMTAIWSAEGDLIFTESKETFPLVGSQAAYTIGEGGDFNTVRPQYFSHIHVTSGEIDYTLTMIDNRQYGAISQKNVQSIPQKAYYDAGYPLGTLYLYPKPSSVTSITLYSFKPLSEFTSLNTEFNMPKEYKAALVYNLAIWLADEYEIQPSANIQKLASQTKDVVEAQNKRNEFFTSVVDVPADRSRAEGNIYEGYYT
jgi:hypothetical protein